MVWPGPRHLTPGLRGGSVRAVGHVTGRGGLEEVRGEAWAEFDGDWEGVEAAVSGARPAPAHTDLPPAGVEGGGGGGEAVRVQPGW